MKKPSDWLLEHYMHIPQGGGVLDLACGSGRHSEFLSGKGYQLTAVDIDITAVTEANLQNTSIIQADLEREAWPFPKGQFSGIVVTNYLWRAHFPHLMKSLKPGGVLIFDTFMVGNEKYGRPSNPKFLLKSEELKIAFSEMELLAYQEGYQDQPTPAMRQSIVAQKP